MIFLLPSLFRHYDKKILARKYRAMLMDRILPFIQQSAPGEEEKVLPLAFCQYELIDSRRSPFLLKKVRIVPKVFGIFWKW